MDYIKNNNQSIVTRIALRSLKSNKGRSIAAVITITLSACIELSLLLATLSSYQANYNSVKDAFQAVIKNVSSDELIKLESDNKIKKVGASYFIDYIPKKDGDVFFVYYNDVMLEQLHNIRGDYPTNEYEVLVSQSYLNMTGQKADIGSTIELETKNIKGVFTITAIMDDEELPSNTITVFLSKSFLERITGNDSIRYKAYIWLDGGHRYSTADVVRALYPVIEPILERTSFNLSYFRYAGNFLGSDNSLSIMLIGGTILFAAAIVVYSMFYISVGNKIRDYGQLRTLGATKKQIRKIVAYEGIALAFIGGTAGIIFGCVTGYFLQPDGWNWSNTFWSIVFVALFEILVIWLSVRTPAKIAANAPPTEAGRFLTYTGISKRTENAKAIHKKSTPLQLALLNLVRFPKKTLLTMLSLGLCGMLFICTASLQKNITAEKEVRLRMFPYGDYKLTLIGGENDNFSEIQQLNTPLNDELRQKILSINGVKSIYEWKKVNGIITAVNNNAVDSQIYIYGIAPQHEEQLTDASSKGTVDYDTLTQSSGIIIYSTGAAIRELGGWTPRTGDTVTFKTLSGSGEYEENTYPVMCIISKHKSFKGLIMMTNDTLQNITGTDCTESFEIITDASGNGDIEQQLDNLSQLSPDIRYETFSAAVNARQADLSAGFGMFFLLAFLLGVFGVINLANTNITNIISRKQEIGILQSVGMTKKQVSLCLLIEDFVNTLAATLITILAGFPFGYLACFLMNEELCAMYSFPWRSLLLYFAALLMVQLFLTVYNVWSISQTPVVERINKQA